MSCHSMNSRNRCRFPSVPAYWNVACTTYGVRFRRSCIRCVKNVCPLQNMLTGRMPIFRVPP